MHLATVLPGAWTVGSIVFARRSRWEAVGPKPYFLLIAPTARQDCFRALRIARAAEPLSRAELVLPTEAALDMRLPVSGHPWAILCESPSVVRPIIRIAPCPPNVWAEVLRRCRRLAATQQIEGGH